MAKIDKESINWYLDLFLYAAVFLISFFWKSKEGAFGNDYPNTSTFYSFGLLAIFISMVLYTILKKGITSITSGLNLLLALRILCVLIICKFILLLCMGY